MWRVAIVLQHPASAFGPNLLPVWYRHRVPSPALLSAPPWRTLAPVPPIKILPWRSSDFRGAPIVSASALSDLLDFTLSTREGEVPWGLPPATPLPSFQSCAECNACMTSISDGGALASEHFDCIIDCGASCPVSPILSDFSDFVGVPADTQKVLKGLATGLEIRGEGNLAYGCQLASGGTYVFKAKGLYVPESPRRLFSPQFYLQTLSEAEKREYKDPKFVIRAAQMTAELTPSLVIPVPYFTSLCYACTMLRPSMWLSRN
jgi:hypothetical protein